ncbi:hypothetical protein ACVDG5_018175 [Mesorhizobium sp. ORM6]
MSAKLSEARYRALAYMDATGCTLARAGGYSTGWTRDHFQWPVATSTIEALINSKFIALDPAESNQFSVYRITEAGRQAIAKGPA